MVKSVKQGQVSENPSGVGRDAGKFAEELSVHLSGLVGSEVELTLEIGARLPDVVPEKVVRTVTENARTLKFGSKGFEGK